MLGLLNRYLDYFRRRPQDAPQGTRRGEAGNVFFTLFGAVALVGVVGVATSTLMRGPVGTVVQLNQRAKADAQMQIAQRLAMLEAAQQADNGDCDGDGFVEPIGPKTTGCSSSFPGISGGGCIPDSIGASKIDPWGTDYGYCSWDHGGIVGSGCGANGGGNLRGSSSGTGTVIAIISAGPDRTFNSSCQDHSNYVVKTPGSDDIVLEITYDGAVEATGGLWRLQSGDPGTAEIDRNIYVSGGGEFEGTGRFGQGLNIDAGLLDMRGGSLIMLPDQGSSGPCTAGVNDGALRRNTFGNNEVLEICDPNPPNNGWVNVATAAATSGAQGPEGALQISDGLTPRGFDYVSALHYSAGTLTTDGLHATANAGVDGNLTVGGNTSISGSLQVDGPISDGDSAVTIADDFVVTGESTLQDTDITNLDVSGTLNVDGTSTLGVVNAGTTSLSSLSVSGTANFAGAIFNSSGNLNLNDNVDVSGDLDVSGNAEIDGRVYSRGFVHIDNGRNEGLYFTSADGLYLGVGGTPALTIDSGGDVGIGISGLITATLDVSGEIRLRSSASYASGSGCSAPGMISYNGADELLICSSLTNLWETIGTSGGGSSGSGGLWNNEGAYIRYQHGSYIIDEGTSSAGYPALEGTGTRMMWYPGKAAFRAGAVTGTQWSNSRIGSSSTAFGTDTAAEGNYSFAAGRASIATGENAVAMGYNARAEGTSSIALGQSVNILSSANHSMGIGLGQSAGGSAIPAIASQHSLGIFMGDQADVLLNATDPVMLLAGGKLVIDPRQPAQSLAPSLNLVLDVEGQVGATQYCDQNGLNCFLASDVALGTVAAPGADTEIIFNSGGILGTEPGFVYVRDGGGDGNGGMGIGVTAPDARLDVDGTIKMAYGGEDCDAPRIGAMHFDSTDNSFYVCQSAGTWQRIVTTGSGAGLPAAGNDRQVQFNSGNELAADTNFVYTDNGTFIVGRHQVNGSGNRMFYEPTLGAFRAGGTAGNGWNYTSLGAYSAAFGWQTLASGGPVSRRGMIHMLLDLEVSRWGMAHVPPVITVWLWAMAHKPLRKAPWRWGMGQEQLHGKALQ